MQPSTWAIAAGALLEMNNPICGFGQIPHLDKRQFRELVGLNKRLW